MSPNPRKRVGIIGAGVAGLATAKILLAEGHDCTVYERRDQLGGVWADGYANFGVQVQKELYQFPDWPLPDETPNFTPGPIFQKYLEDFVDHFGLRPHIRLSSPIKKVEPQQDGSGWAIVLEENGQERREDFDLLVIATGLYSETPNIPDIPGRERFAGEVLHISDLKSRERLSGKRVAVLGYGKSATDAALEGEAVGQEVHLIFREAHWPVPRNLAGLLPFKWGMLNRMTAALIPPYLRPSPLAHTLHSYGGPLPWIFWRAVALLLYFQWGLGTKIARDKNLVPSVPVEIGCFHESTMVPRPGLYHAIREGRIKAHRTTIKEFTNNGISLEDGDELEVDTVVLGTGWQNDHRIFSDETKKALGEDDDGFYLYRHMLQPDLPGLFFIGRASTFLSVLTYSLQARWLAELLKGNIALPSAGHMQDEIAHMKEWKRSWMPFNASRGARLLLHMLHYHDELLRDFGANPLRKRGPFAPVKELFAPYQPSDYATIASGDWEKIEGKVARPTTGDHATLS